jgi:hypothetical protein
MLFHLIYRFTPAFPKAGAVTTEKRPDDQVPYLILP